MGKVYLVGAGPGSPDLISVRAARLLAQADVVFYDSLANTELLALAGRAEKFAVGKRCGRHSTAQTFINKRLVEAARRHGVVVRLKGGDPMLFGRAQEEIDALAAAGIEVEVVPGITAALAASAALGVSLTRRGVSRSVAFVTPRIGPGERKSDWIGAALAADTAVIYMGVGEAGAIRDALMERGLDGQTPVAVVQNASLPNERLQVMRLDQLGATKLAEDGPATIVIGEVLRERALAAARAALSGDAPARALAS